MATVSLNINGLTYDIACDDGQEQRVRSLGAYIDQRVRDLAQMGGNGAVNKSQLLVLTSMMLADEVFDAREALNQVGKQGKTPVSVKPAPEQPIFQGLSPEEEAALTDEIARLASRIDNLSNRLQAL